MASQNTQTLSSASKQPSNSFASSSPSTSNQMSFMNCPIIHEIINYQPTFSLSPSSSSYHGYNNIMKRSFQCRICSIKFPTAQAYGGHMSYHSKLKKAQERQQEEEKKEDMNVSMKGKKHGRVEEVEKKKNFGYGSDGSASAFCLAEGFSDFKKKRK